MRKIILWNCLALIGLGIVLSGCTTTKLPAGDIEVLQKYKTEIDILRNPKIRANTEIKYDAAKVIFANVDFSYARDYKELEQIFGFSDVVGKTLYGGKKSLVFKYSWKDRVIEGNFFFTGHSITGCKIKEYAFDPAKPRKIKSFNTIKKAINSKSEWNTNGAK
jgi:hypothetical protein